MAAAVLGSWLAVTKAGNTLWQQQQQQQKLTTTASDTVNEFEAINQPHEETQT